MIKKKMVAIMLCFGMLFSTSVTAFAAETEIGETDTYIEVERDETSANAQYSFGSVNTGDILSPAETVEEQLSGLSEDQIEIAVEKLNDDAEGSDITPYATTWNHLSGFTIYKQSESYYCVVASCKAAMQYLTGDSDSQSTIASALGTTTSGTPFSNAKTYLNDHQTANTYVSRAATTEQSTMESNFYSAINTYDAPPLISVKLSTTNGWAYNTSGHTMCISGARSDKAYFRIADPYIQWVDSDASMFYSKSSSSIHTAISDRGNGYIY